MLLKIANAMTGLCNAIAANIDDIINKFGTKLKVLMDDNPDILNSWPKKTTIRVADLAAASFIINASILEEFDGDILKLLVSMRSCEHAFRAFAIDFPIL